MADYATDEEQLDAIKRWWKENGNFILLGLFLGILVIASVNGWRWYKNKQANESSELFYALESNLQQSSDTFPEQIYNQLTNDYKATPYASLASFSYAKFLVESGELDKAQTVLGWVIENSKSPEFVELALIRSAPVLIAAGNPEQALDNLNRSTADSFEALREEYRGDAFVKLNKFDEAKKAYDQALESGSNQSEFLRWKLDALGGEA